MSHLRRWGALYILTVLFVASLVGQWFTQLAEYTADQAEHGQPFEWSGYLSSFSAEMFANWQSEWLQLFTQALLISAFSRVLFRKGDEDRERLERKVDALVETAVQHHLLERELHTKVAKLHRRWAGAPDDR